MSTISLAFKNIFRQKFLTITNITVTTLIFLLLNILLIGLFFINKYSSYQESQLTTSIFFHKGCIVSSDITSEVIKILKKSDKVIEIKFYSEEDNINFYFDEIFKNEPYYLSQKTNLNKCNLPASMHIRFADPDSYKKITNSFINNASTNLNISKNTKETITYSELDNYFKDKTDKKIIDLVQTPYSEYADNFAKILNFVRYAIITIVIFIIIAVFLVYLLIFEVSIRTRTEEIGVMQLMGAKKSQISGPFIIEGAIYGLLSGLIASLIIVVIYLYIYNYLAINDTTLLKKSIEDLGINISIDKIYLILAIIVESVCTAILGIFNTSMALRKYIK